MTEGPVHSMTPTTPLMDGERVVESFRPDRATYWRDHAWMAVAAMALGMAILWALGNSHVWTGAVGGLAAVMVRAGYIASDELQARWDLTDRRLLGPLTRAVRLSDIETVRGLGSAVQVVTRGGDKHLIKYQADGPATRARIERAIAGGAI
ncbi:MAG: hypothetical protein U5K36_12600 [Roseovarius sp.]|nr:hypothetical protein [Roseovarius sp.]